MSDPSNSDRTFRSFSALGAALGRPEQRRIRNHERSEAYKAKVADAAAHATPARHFSPLIPCSQCSRLVAYEDAVPREFTDGGYGYCHPVGTCDSNDVKRWQAQLALYATFNEHATRRRAS